jgi:hypothetical protein
MKKCLSNIPLRRKSLSYAVYVRASSELMTQLRCDQAETINSL